MSNFHYYYIAYFFMFCLGACFGSFASVLIYRLPLEISFIKPRSFCAVCQKNIPFYHNIPIFSWLYLRGKCAFCNSKIGLRTFFIENLFALLLATLFLKYGLSFELVEKFIFCFLLICILYIDMDFLFIPISLLLSLTVLGIVSATYYHINPSHHSLGLSVLNLSLFNNYFTHSISLLDKVIAAFLAAGFFSLLNLLATFLLRKTLRLTKDQWAMGWGDPWLIFALGLFLGTKLIIATIFLASFLGSIVGIAYKLFGAKFNSNQEFAAKDSIPYGPFLAFAAMFFYLV